MTPLWTPITLASLHPPAPAGLGRILTALGQACAAAGLLLILASSGQAHAEDTLTTTTVHNGTSRASVSQSGGAGPAAKRVETRPGYTRIEQKSGGNHAVVVQSSDPADLRDLPQLQQLPKELRDLLGLTDPSKP